MLNSNSSKTSVPDVVTHDLQSLNLHGGEDSRSFLLLDQEETICVEDVESWVVKLGCDLTSQCKVVSILGNTGEGKSHTLNHTFFAGAPVFSTSSQQESCTTGVWATYDPELQVVILDTEGMLGAADNENVRTRLLLKVLAVSDIVIYRLGTSQYLQTLNNCSLLDRTRAERLHNDMFYFLGDASRAYLKHFQVELDKMEEQNFKSEETLTISPSSSSMGPTIVIFHETLHTDVLCKVRGGPEPETVIRERFRTLKLDISAFSKIKYVGTKSDTAGRTNFGTLREMLGRELVDTSTRSQRNVQLVLQAFHKLNAKFTGNMTETSHRCFPDEYFTCAARCKVGLSSSSSLLTLTPLVLRGPMYSPDEALGGTPSSTGLQVHLLRSVREQDLHLQEVSGGAGDRSQESHVLNLILQENGRKCVVVPKASSSKEGSIVGLAKYAWSGYVLECQRCGVIYRSRQQWYGNTDPEHLGVVHTEIAHVWPGVRHDQVIFSAEGFSQVSLTQSRTEGLRVFVLSSEIVLVFSLLLTQ